MTMSMQERWIDKLDCLNWGGGGEGGRTIFRVGESANVVDARRLGSEGEGRHADLEVRLS